MDIKQHEGPDAPDKQALLSIKELSVKFGEADSAVLAVNKVSFDVSKGETLGIVGESGSGKSVTLLAALGLLPSPPAHIAGGTVVFEGRDLLKEERSCLRNIRGKEIGYIFQDPQSSLNPVMKIGDQIAETLLCHHTNLGKAQVRERVLELLTLVNMADPARLMGQYPHQLSGGMRQRIMIAIAIANNPKLLIADEPTTALDVTIQAQVLDLMKKAQKETGASLILVSHDLGVISQMASKVIVMYAGEVIESGSVSDVLDKPLHPYTYGLIDSAPTLDTTIEGIHPIPGQAPNPADMPSGCHFHPRCKYRRDICRTRKPDYREISDGRHVACHFAGEILFGDQAFEDQWQDSPRAGETAEEAQATAVEVGR